jgi:hypothetical protein
MSFRIRAKLFWTVKCELCGRDTLHSRAVIHRLDDFTHYFCSLECGMRWERLDGARGVKLGSRSIPVRPRGRVS